MYCHLATDNTATAPGSTAGSDQPKAAQGWSRILARRHGGPLLLVGVALILASAMRAGLLFASLGNVTWGWSLLAAFGWGLLFDLGAAALMFAPAAVLLALLPRTFFRFRAARALGRFTVFAAVAGMLFVALAEVLFWDEFGARFNFIAVDYLVYTTEVIGNIRESYPLPALLGGTIALAAAATWMLGRAGSFRIWFQHAEQPTGARWVIAGAWVLTAAIFATGLAESRVPAFANNYHRELAKNGVWAFFAAFRANQLDFDQFYATMPPDAAFNRLHRLIGDGARPIGDDPHDLLRLVSHSGPEKRLNVIQIKVESSSASFLGACGSTEGLTPNLDALAPLSLVFDRFFATGNRTDRGMEALALSVPPTPGRSLVKRPHNENLFTLGSVFRGRGYDTAFLYGGYGYFDNMNDFFGGNGYRVVDRAAVNRDDVTFANAWGACDGDLYRWTLREADAAHAKGRPFFHFVMTTSNHRPYTFPEGEIEVPSKISGRNGAVKYTDHAIGEFLEAASRKPWFRDTIFVIVAEHCASSAGRAELPVDKYQVPMIIFSPGGQIAPGHVTAFASQIDYAPTLLGLLNWTYPSRFFGRDVLASDGLAHRDRALIGNYQRLGLFVGDAAANLAVLSPVRQMATFHYDPATHETTPVEREEALMADTIAYYQTASFLFKNGKQGEYATAAN